MSALIIDLKLDAQIKRCKIAVKEYFNEQCVRIDEEALWAKLDPPSLLFQFSHMIAFHKMHWQDALAWTVTNKGQIMAYAEGKLDEWGKPKDEQAIATVE